MPEGAIAQLGERLLCKQEVVGSIPSGSTRSAVAIRWSPAVVGCSDGLLARMIAGDFGSVWSASVSAQAPAQNLRREIVAVGILVVVAGAQ